MESSAPSDSEVQAVIKFLNMEGVTRSEIHRRLSNGYVADNVMSLCHIYKRIECFNTKRSDTHDEQRLAKQDTEWCSADSYRLILRYNKCLNEQGDYIEK